MTGGTGKSLKTHYSRNSIEIATSVHERLQEEGYRVFPLKGGNTGGSRYLDVFHPKYSSKGITLRFSDHEANIGGRYYSESGRRYSENDVASYEQAKERMKERGIELV
jgi:hypothetical protein